MKQRRTHGEGFSFVINQFLSILKLLEAFESTKQRGEVREGEKGHFKISQVRFFTLALSESRTEPYSR